MEFLDLTAELAHGMVRHPAPHLPPVEVLPVATHEVQKRSVQKVVFGTHVSTHIDAPRHAIPNGATIDEIPLDALIGEAALLRLPAVSKARPIDEADLQPFEATIAANPRIVLETGWARETWGTPRYFTEGPYLTRAAAHYLARFPIRLIGMDFPNIDSAEETRPGISAPNHVILLGKGLVLVENLLRLHEIKDATFRLIALPLRLIGGDGCPCRVVAEI
jgi:kynurenine formamidase